MIFPYGLSNQLSHTNKSVQPEALALGTMGRRLHLLRPLAISTCSAVSNVLSVGVGLFAASGIGVEMWVCVFNGVCPCSEVISLVGPPISPEQLESKTRLAVG